MRPTLRIALLGLLIAAASAAGALFYMRQSEIAKEAEVCNQSVYELASALEGEGKPQAAYRLFGDYLCEGVFFTPSAGNEHPCTKAAALQRRIGIAYEQSMEKLVAYRAAHGRYPTTLDEVSFQLSEPVRQVVRGFEYVRKSDTEIAIVTGMYGPTAFALNQTPNPSIERTCPGKPGQASHVKR